MLKGSWAIKVGGILILAIVDWLVGKGLNSFSDTVAKMPDIDKLSWSIVVFLLLVGVFLFFSPVIDKWIHNLGGDKKKEAEDGYKEAMKGYLNDIQRLTRENSLQANQIEELQKRTITDNKSEVDDKSTKNAPSRLIHDDVLWEDDGDYYNGGIIVEGPFCPKDYATLMMEHVNAVEKLNFSEIISNQVYHFRLYCPECKHRYTLGEKPKTTNDSFLEVRSRFEGLRKRSQIG